MSFLKGEIEFEKELFLLSFSKKSMCGCGKKHG